MKQTPEAPESKAVDQVRREEMARGTRRRRYDSEAIEQRRERERQMADIIRYCSREEFQRALASTGMRRGSAQWLAALKAFDDYRAKR